MSAVGALILVPYAWIFDAAMKFIPNAWLDNADITASMIFMNITTFITV
jgi:hypothetical protein